MLNPNREPVLNLLIKQLETTLSLEYAPYYLPAQIQGRGVSNWDLPDNNAGFWDETVRKCTQAVLLIPGVEKFSLRFKEVSRKGNTTLLVYYTIEKNPVNETWYFSPETKTITNSYLSITHNHKKTSKPIRSISSNGYDGRPLHYISKNYRSKKTGERSE